MERKWLNETRTDEEGHIVEVLPDENGEFTLEIINSRGNRVSTFKGKSMVEVNEKMAEAQVQANRQLGRLMKPDKGRDNPFQATPQPISAEDRTRYSTGIIDPDRVVEVIEEVVTRRQGAAPAAMGAKVATFDKEAADRFYRAEANAFVQAHPDYYPTADNQIRLFSELEKRGYDLTRNNLAIVYEALADEGQMDMWPDSSTQPDNGTAPPSNGAVTELPPPAPPPRAVPRSSGLRSSDASALKPPPPKPRPLITKAELDKMGRHEYEERLRDPAFRKAVDSLGR
jgi:hypothetical protein